MLAAEIGSAFTTIKCSLEQNPSFLNCFRKKAERSKSISKLPYKSLQKYNTMRTGYLQALLEKKRGGKKENINLGEKPENQ